MDSNLRPSGLKASIDGKLGDVLEINVLYGWKTQIFSKLVTQNI